jgi:hypothetical protein
MRSRGAGRAGAVSERMLSRTAARWLTALGAAAALGASLLAAAPGRAATLPTGFQDEIVFSGPTNPTDLQFASHGRIFVAERGGRIKVFDSLTTAPSTTAPGRRPRRPSPPPAPTPCAFR